MPKIIIHTDPNRTGTCDVPPFVVGDSTSAWELEFVDTDGVAYTPSGVSMHVGHVNGLPNGSYPSAFKWTDRAGNDHIASVTVSSGVPSLSFDTNPLGGVIGDSGVYVIRGPELDGRITSIEVLNKGAQYLGTYVGAVPLTIEAVGSEGGGGQALAVLEIDPGANPGGASGLGQMDQCIYTNSQPGSYTSAPSAYVSGPAPVIGSSLFTVNTGGVVGVGQGSSVSLGMPSRGSGYATDGNVTFTGGTISGSVLSSASAYLARARVGYVSILSAGSGYLAEPIVTDSGTAVVSRPGSLGRSAAYRARVAAAQFSTPFFSSHSSSNVLAACKVRPYTDGRATSVTEYDHSVLVVRPRDVATASLALGPSGWTGTMNPINNYVLARLSVARSTVLDMQVFGDGRMLFQGAMAILDRIN